MTQNWTISKQFEFCYGHRVHNQTLNAELSLDSCLACRHFHGHQGTVLVSLSAKELTNGMVTDFKHLGWFKKWLDDILDHKMILDINDPIVPISFPILKSLKPEETATIGSLLDFNETENYYLVWPDLYENLPTHETEIYEGLILVPFVPTSENLSKWLWEIVNKKMGHLCKVSQVQFYETPKSQSVYTNV